MISRAGVLNKKDSLLLKILHMTLKYINMIYDIRVLPILRCTIMTKG